MLKAAQACLHRCGNLRQYRLIPAFRILGGDIAVNFNLGLQRQNIHPRHALKFSLSMSSSDMNSPSTVSDSSDSCCVTFLQCLTKVTWSIQGRSWASYSRSLVYTYYRSEASPKEAEEIL